MTSSVLLWGGIGSGKSGLIGALYDVGAGSGPAAARWGLLPGDTGDNVVASYLDDMRNGLLKRTTSPTQPTANYPQLDLIVRKRAGREVLAELDLTFVDPAGELSEDLDRLSVGGQHLLQQMLEAGGLIWLFDAQQKAASHTVVAGQLAMLAEMIESGYVSTPLALCLSKIDLLTPAARAAAQKNPTAALRAHLGENVFDRFRRVFNVHECFAVSSAGFEAGRIRPEGINEVFEWIFQKQAERKNAVRRRQFARIGIPAAVAVFALIFLIAGLNNFFRDRAATAERVMHQREARLDRATELFRVHESDSVVALLRTDELPKNHPRSGEWNRMLTLAARNIALEQNALGKPDNELLRLVEQRAKSALANLDSPDDQAQVRFARAQVCMILKCPSRSIAQDLVFVRNAAQSADLRRDAAKLAEELEATS